ncbi:testicular haploid expressed gene [Ptiloglossa arizonensis]|uniref:testicular haploid expressed gene n=1 Tax=Ptiloglossa arizonensis TaxID=3350558 RepID=UPI003FA1220E
MEPYETKTYDRVASLRIASSRVESIESNRAGVRGRGSRLRTKENRRPRRALMSVTFSGSYFFRHRWDGQRGRRDKKLAERIKYAMKHLSHKQYTSLLARPNWRRIQRMNIHTVANPFTIKPSALRARASKRIKIMARPKHVTRKYDPSRMPPFSYLRIHPKTLEAKITKRIADLALPSKSQVLANTRFHASGVLAELLWKIQNSRYQRYRFFCNARHQRETKKKQKILARLQRVIKPNEWNQHMAFIDKLSAPKLPPKPTYPGRRRKWRPVNMTRIDELAVPMIRKSPETRDPFVVPKSALVYKISKNLVKLAFPRTQRDTGTPRIPGSVNPAALKAIASPRTILLAKPTERPAGIETDVKENAFKVSPKALKAKCSRRLKFLAKPKKYR